MSDAALPDGQRRIRARCVHPTGVFEPFPRVALEQSIAARFEACVRAYPARRAIRTPTQDLTYADLDRAADRIALAIAARPAVERVALLFEHGAQGIAAMLGALKAGAAYVPLDPSYPVARLRYLIEDSQSGLVLTNTENLPLAEALGMGAVPIADIDRLAVERAATPARRAVSPERLAFILYTSGSTGQPKGVPQPHVNVLQDVMHYTNAAHFCAHDRFLLVSSFSFADSVRTIYGALLNGASLHAFDVALDGLPALGGWLREQEITIYRSVPTVFRHFTAQLPGGEQFPHVRLIILSGEPVPTRDLDGYHRHFSPECILLNRLGTAEALTFSCYFMDRDTVVTGPTVPVGWAVADKDIVLLDETADAASGARTGEIGVRSRYLSPGYWRKPDLSAETFVDAHGPDGVRLYRTGDLGRVLADGCLVHLGRKDFQVKVRGRRIEVGEIEMVLLDHPAVKEAAVMAGADRHGETRLTAYVTLGGDTPPSVGELRRFLGECVPDFLVPAAFVVLDAFPRTSSGKLDRRALRPPDTVRPVLGAPFVPPETELERIVAGIWADVLELDEVGRHDPFLDLGGDSLRAGLVVTRIVATLGTDVPRRELLGAETVADMASVLLAHALRSGAR